MPAGDIENRRVCEMLRPAPEHESAGKTIRRGERMWLVTAAEEWCDCHQEKTANVSYVRP